MSATQVFRCEELATEIFNYLAPGPLRNTDTIQYRLRRRERQKALARAARICHACTTPALNILWRVVDNIYILLSLLPPTTRGRKSYIFDRDLTPSEWERFQQYATRVRELHWRTPPISQESVQDCDSGIDLEICPSVWMILAKWCQGKGLLPRLTYLAPLHLSSNRPGSLLLVSPTLRHMSISIDQTVLGEEDLALSSLFSCLSSVFASLESLAIDADSDLELVDNWLMTADCETRLLNLLDIRALQRLEFQPSSDTISKKFASQQPTTPPSPLRATLRELRLSGDPHLLVKFIEYAVGPTLEVLGLQFDDIELIPMHEVRVMLERIVARISPHATRFSLTLDGIHDEIPQEMQEVLAAELLRPLLPKSCLTHVVLHLKYKRKYGLFTQQDMTDLTDAWPNLVELRIYDTHPQPPYNDDWPAPSVADLMRFAQRHPRLEHLVLPSLDAAADSLPALHEVPQLSHRLEILRIHTITGYPYYRTTFALAQILDRLFPNLDLCRPQFEGPRGFGNKVDVWDDVERALLALQTGRRGGCVV
ncbi:hypothetical protein ONZ51_g408 [Trametes cubensis]|uniref:Uncharacterized protein n=1 Tax=Trametes cubensis TaxID=1111947 RepID=A0AAD7U3G9_9APHY|nr:hypothetical protein ONZ51_g408 [Trametes cubensis]